MFSLIITGVSLNIHYCMGETAIVYITVVILLTPRKTGGSGGHTPSENGPYVAANEKWALCQNRHYHCDRKKIHTNPGVIKSRLQHESVCVEIGKTNERRTMRVREG